MARNSARKMFRRLLNFNHCHLIFTKTLSEASLRSTVFSSPRFYQFLCTAVHVRLFQPLSLLFNNEARKLKREASYMNCRLEKLWNSGTTGLSLVYLSLSVLWVQEQCIWIRILNFGPIWIRIRKIVPMLYILNLKVFVWWIFVFIKLSFFLFLPVWNRIRIRNTDPDPQSCWMYGSNKDPDPKSSWIRIQLWSGSQKLLNTDPMRIRIHTVAEYGSYSIWSTCTEGRPPPPPARPGSPCHCSPPPALQQRENVIYLFIWTGGAVLYSCFSGG